MHLAHRFDANASGPNEKKIRAIVSCVLVRTALLFQMDLMACCITGVYYYKWIVARCSALCGVLCRVVLGRAVGSVACLCAC